MSYLSHTSLVFRDSYLEQAALSSQVRCLGRRRKYWSLNNQAINATLNYSTQALNNYGVRFVGRSS
ncbi:MAG: hypothetical protein F6K56_46090 [Moorea sp. SIO3G5]|nr:hypothetical protein [Moorena sp. SIO3G5]